MKLQLFQYDPAWEDKETNRQKILNLINNNPPDGDLLIFPEMTLTGFSMQPKILAENKIDQSFHFFSDLSRKFSLHILAGIMEKEEEKFFNTILHINPSGNLESFYRKIHPFSYSKEDENYSGGEQPAVTFINDWKIGLSVCYDLRFPELYRLYAKERVDLIINIANWPVPRIEHWRTLLKARAIENQCFAAGVNRVGNDPSSAYNGFSSVFDPMGKEIVAVEDEEKIITAEIDKTKVDEVRNKLPFLNDIRLI
jgi:predicted amidohydrolase